MSRSGYTEDDGDDPLSLGRWRGQVASAIRGKRGQAMLKELAAAMDAMSVKALAAESLVTADGEFCTLGALGAARGLDMKPLDPEDWDAVAKAFGVAPALVREVVYFNDEALTGYEYVQIELCGPVRPWFPECGLHTRSVRVDIAPVEMAAQRWAYMRAWVAKQITPEVPA